MTDLSSPPEPDEDLRELLREQASIEAPQHMGDEIMDQVYELARVRRQTHRSWRRARRMSVLTTLLLGTLLSVVFLGQGSITALADASESTWMNWGQAGFMAILVGLWWWQIDDLWPLLRGKRR